ncbi:MAG: nucleotide exchange factor GrpE [Bacteroidia bacterium]|nr:nucleotide exchange factor GrpE [Bacteroidia bacterium]
MEPREQIKEYLIQAIDALSEEEVNEISAYWKEPDLSTFTNELVALKSEVKKNNTISQKLTNDILVVTDKINDSLKIAEEVKKEVSVDDNIKEIISKIFDFDETLGRTLKEYEELPTLSLLNYFKYKTAFLCWRVGFEILTEKWDEFLLLNQLSVTGKEGEFFDPSFHEAIETINDDDFENNEITECLEKGYLFKSALIRRAKVVVNKL